MSAEPRALKTEAEQTLAEQYRAVRASLPGSPAVARKRDELFAQFERAGLPHRRVEAWKYTDLRALLRKAAPLADAPAADVVRAALDVTETFPGLDRFRLVIADGVFQPAASDVDALGAEGVRVASVAQFLAVDHPNVLDLLETPAAGGDDSTIALNGALATGGIVLIVAAGSVVSKPVEIVHLATGGATASFSRSAVQVGASGRLSLLVSRFGPIGVAYQASTVVGLAVAENAAVRVVDAQLQGDLATDLATFNARLATGATLDHLAVAAGARTARLSAFVTIEGEGVRVGAFGVNMLDGSGHGDVALVIDHAKPASASRVLYKNVAAGSAAGAFEGRIVVRPDAQKTDGRMLINTLLLSDDAEFSAKPELEIYADDVQCGHGATTGEIDDNLLFYLRSRGVPLPVARALLLKAFLSEAVEAMGDEALAAAIEPIVDAWLGRQR